MRPLKHVLFKEITTINLDNVLKLAMNEGLSEILYWRIRIFLWLVAHNSLLTNARRVARNWSNNLYCHLCQLKIEYTTHILWDCPAASNIRRQLLQQHNMDDFFSASLKPWLLNNLSSKVITADRWKWFVIFGVALWSIWKKRNNLIFRHQNNPQAV